MDSDEIPYVVQKMTLDDVPAVTAIERMVFPLPWSAYAFAYELRYNPAAHFLVVRLRGVGAVTGEIPEQEAAVGQILGYGGFWLFLDEAHICTLAVHPDWQGRGLGALLLTSLIEHAIELDAAIVTLEVRASNLMAQKLYCRYGFAQVGLRKRYYSDNSEDALIMTTEPISSSSFQKRFKTLKSSLLRKLASNSN